MYANIPRFPGISLADDQREERIRDAIESDDELVSLETLKRDLESVQKQITDWNSHHSSSGDDVDEWCVFDVADTLATVNYLITKRTEQIRDEGE